MLRDRRWFEFLGIPCGVTGLIVASLVGLAPATGLPASFDCAKAATAAEKTVCSDPDLSLLDEQLADAYAKALRFTSDPKALRQEQQKWLTAVRDRCGVDTDCLSRGYDRRIQDLLLRLRDTKKEEKKPALYRLVEGAGEPVCQTMLKQYNDDIAKFGIEQYSGPEFSQIQWRAVPFREALGASNPKVAILDLYNDKGREAVISYRNSGLGGPVLTRDFTDHRIGRHKDEWDPLPAMSISAKDLFARTTSMSPNELYFVDKGKTRRLFGPEISEPFIYEGVTYVSVRELPRASARSGLELPGEKAILILKYLRNIDKYNKPTAKTGMTREEELAFQRQYFMTMCIFTQD